MGNKIRRNQPCPCGKGMKYKYCCLLKEQENIKQQKEISKTVAELMKKSEEKLPTPEEFKSTEK